MISNIMGRKNVNVVTVDISWSSARRLHAHRIAALVVSWQAAGRFGDLVSALQYGSRAATLFARWPQTVIAVGQRKHYGVPWADGAVPAAPPRLRQSEVLAWSLRDLIKYRARTN